MKTDFDYNSMPVSFAHCLNGHKGCCRLYVDATNLTDTEYFDFGGLRMPGTWISGGVVLTLGRR